MGSQVKAVAKGIDRIHWILLLVLIEQRIL
jgi:hypothetical protein